MFGGFSLCWYVSKPYLVFLLPENLLGTGFESSNTSVAHVYHHQYIQCSTQFHHGIYRVCVQRNFQFLVVVIVYLCLLILNIMLLSLFFLSTY